MLKQALLVVLLLLNVVCAAYAGTPRKLGEFQDKAPMALIPAGDFSMGEVASAGEAADERPLHKLYLDAFYIDKYEVTNAQYEKFDPQHKRSKYSVCDDCPVTNVSWTEAKAYCTRQAKRLPTEAEWEKAARGPDGFRYAYGNTYDKESARSGRLWPDGALKVGSYAANGYGIYDMTGNVWEWCSDWYAADYYSKSPAKNPQGPKTGERRILRGGGWNTKHKYSRNANRLCDEPVMRFHVFGFRCAKGM